MPSLPAGNLDYISRQKPLQNPPDILYCPWSACTMKNFIRSSWAVWLASNPLWHWGGGEGRSVIDLSSILQIVVQLIYQSNHSIISTMWFNGFFYPRNLPCGSHQNTTSGPRSKHWFPFPRDQISGHVPCLVPHLQRRRHSSIVLRVSTASISCMHSFLPTTHR